MRPATRNQRGRGKTLKPLCPSCGAYMVRQYVKLGPFGGQKWMAASWICPYCGSMTLDNDRFKQFQIL